MEQITAYLLNALEIIEKELALLKRLAAKTFIGLGWFATGVFVLAIGFLLLVWTCFTAVSILFGPVAAGLLASALLLLGGGIFLWLSRKSLK